MKKLHFIFKVKDEYIPDYIRTNKNILLANDYPKIYKIDNPYIRKLKLENLEESISDINKKILNYLLDDKLIDYLTEKEFEEKKSNFFGTSWTGSSGIAGPSGVFGMSGTAGSAGIGSSYPVGGITPFI